MPAKPERIDDAAAGLRPVTVTTGPYLGLFAWYREARRNGWTRRAALVGARRHRIPGAWRHRKAWWPFR